jgi:thymidylate kinase
MRFALTGAHGTGKSSVLNGLADYLASHQIEVQNNSSSARHIIQSGMTINENGDDLVQLIVQSSHVQKFCKDRWMTDRCVIDGYAYTEYLHKQGKVSVEALNITRTLLQKFLPLYDFIFYVPIEFPIVDDQVRSQASHFQRDIDDIIYKTLGEYDLTKKMIQLTGSVENRINQVKETLSL